MFLSDNDNKKGKMSEIILGANKIPVYIYSMTEQSVQISGENK
jgi:hypothetical protein